MIGVSLLCLFLLLVSVFCSVLVCFCLFLLVFFVFVVSVAVVSDYDKREMFSLQFLCFGGYGWCKTKFGPHVLLLSVGDLKSPKTYQHKAI